MYLVEIYGTQRAISIVISSSLRVCYHQPSSYCGPYSVTAMCFGTGGVHSCPVIETSKHSNELSLSKKKSEHLMGLSHLIYSSAYQISSFEIAYQNEDNINGLLGDREQKKWPQSSIKFGAWKPIDVNGFKSI